MRVPSAYNCRLSLGDAGQERVGWSLDRVRIQLDTPNASVSYFLYYRRGVVCEATCWTKVRGRFWERVNDWAETQEAER